MSVINNSININIRKKLLDKLIQLFKFKKNYDITKFMEDIYVNLSPNDELRTKFFE